VDLETLQKRAAIIKKTRSFFHKKNYLEIDTPLLCGDLIPESCLEVFMTERIFPRTSRKKNYPLWLIPSPEIWMKKIIARHRVNVFQICKCFRNGESEGFMHSSEFTMLEYYTMGTDYMDSLALTEELFEYIKSDPAQINIKNEKETFNKITIVEAFKKFAGFDLFAVYEKGGEAMEAQARRLGLEPERGMSAAQLYDLIFIHAVEPHLNMQKPVALLDYPAFIPCLAKKSPDGKTVQRWELYWNGSRSETSALELANCFSEETDPQKVKEFFINEEARKAELNVVKHNVDHNYWKLFENGGFPECSGTAMGLDRLVMAVTGKSNINMALVTDN